MDHSIPIITFVLRSLCTSRAAHERKLPFPKDIELCAAFDISEHEELEMHHKFPGIESLHQTLRVIYVEPEAAAAAS